MGNTVRTHHVIEEYSSLKDALSAGNLKPAINLLSLDKCLGQTRRTLGYNLIHGRCKSAPQCLNKKGVFSAVLPAVFRRCKPPENCGNTFILEYWYLIDVLRKGRSRLRYNRKGVLDNGLRRYV